MVYVVKAALNKANFIPLCSDEQSFNGVLNGGNFTIYNLTVVSESFFAGFFAVIGENAKIYDLNILDANITAPNYCGVLAGLCQGIIDNINVSGAINYVEKNSFDIYFGGLIGRAESGISNCVSDVQIDITDANGKAFVGGLVGRTKSDITLCSANGDINISSTKNAYIGGLLGYGEYAYISGGCVASVSHSCATGNITIHISEIAGPTYSAVGGLIGSFNYSASVLNCYALGNVTQAHSGEYVGEGDLGGLIGYAGWVSSVSYSRAEGNITINTAVNIGGLIGRNRDTAVSKCYALGNVTANDARNIGGLIGEGANISDCYALGEVDVNYSAIYSQRYIGGLIGSGVDVFRCYAAGNITVNNADTELFNPVVYLGGLLGGGSGKISDCYATGNIGTNVSVNTVVYAGGLFGRLTSSYQAQASNCYTLSKISVTATISHIGGIAGYTEIANTNCHWLYYADGDAEYAFDFDYSYGIPTNFGAIKYNDIETMYNLATTLNVGSQENIWYNVENGTPILFWQM